MKRAQILLSMLLAVPAMLMAVESDGALTQAEVDARMADIQERVFAHMDAGEADIAHLRDEVNAMADLMDRAEDVDTRASLLSGRARLLAIAGERDAAITLLREHLEDSDLLVSEVAFIALAIMHAESGSADELEALIARAEAEGVGAQVLAQMREELTTARLAPGNPFPSLSFTSASGEELDVADYRGQVVLIDFWASWCGPCMADMPELVELYDAHVDDGFAIIGISADFKEAAMRGAMERMGMTWPQYFDGLGVNNPINRRFGVRSLPTTFLVDKDGTILARNIPVDQLSDILPRVLAEETATIGNADRSN